MCGHNTYDNAYRDMVAKKPQLLIPLINEVFHKDLPPETSMTKLSGSHTAMDRMRDDDSLFQVGDELYHIEVQSTINGNMILRMVEYDLAIGLEQVVADSGSIEINIPNSCVLFLRHNDKTPDCYDITLRAPDGQSLTYESKVVKAQLYDLGQILDKKLLVLLPFYAFRYEPNNGVVGREEMDKEELTKRIESEYEEIQKALDRMTRGIGDDRLYWMLVEHIIKVADKVLVKDKALRDGVVSGMGEEAKMYVYEKVEELEHKIEQLKQEHDSEIEQIKQERDSEIEQIKQERDSEIEQRDSEIRQRDSEIERLTARLRECGQDPEASEGPRS